MSKFDGEMRAAGEGKGKLDEMLIAGGGLPGITSNRQDALAQYLSGEEGWRDARSALDGAFDGSLAATGLISGSNK